MSIGGGASTVGATGPTWREPVFPRRLLRLGPGEQWWPDEIVELVANVSDASLTERVLTVDATRRRRGTGAVVSRSFACLPAYACDRDLAWWLRTLPSWDDEVEERVVEWSACVAERIVAAACAA